MCTIEEVADDDDDHLDLTSGNGIRTTGTLEIPAFIAVPEM